MRTFRSFVILFDLFVFRLKTLGLTNERTNYVHDLFLVTVSFSSSCRLLPKEGTQEKKREAAAEETFSDDDTTFQIVTKLHQNFMYVVQISWRT